LLLLEVAEGKQLRMAVGSDGFWRIVEPTAAAL
jgi:hypothetical protein